MSEPQHVTPDQMRALADGEWRGTNAGVALRAAADEVDRLRADLGTQGRVNADLKRAADVFLDERNRLRAVIENAPHDRDCDSLEESSLGDVWESGRPCTCWKATAL